MSTVRPNLNAVATVGPDLDGAIGSTGLTVLRPNSALDGRYLFHWVTTEDFVRSMVRQATGASYPAVSDRIVKAARIPLPPLTEQLRIARVLDVATAVRGKQRAAMSRVDALGNAIFIDMFGHPRGEPRWPIRPFGEMVQNEDSRRVPIKAGDRENRDGPFPYYGASGIIDYFDDYLFDGHRLLVAEDGANLLTRSTPVAFVVNGRYWVNNHAHVLAENGTADLHYLQHCIELHDLTSLTTGTAQPKLNRANLDRFPVHAPPLELQREFARRLVTVTRLREQALAHAHVLGELFDSLQHRAFDGKL